MNNKRPGHLEILQPPMPHSNLHEIFTNRLLSEKNKENKNNKNIFNENGERCRDVKTKKSMRTRLGG